MSAAIEQRRIQEDAAREKHWKRFGPYLAERQWATVREDYSADGDCWSYFPHEHARSRAYRWGEDGLLGISDHLSRLCFALALWNERDPILKERLFGLTGPEGNHGEDVKEHYFYLDSTPTHSYLRSLYKYPQAEFPYARLVEENRRRDRHEGELELEHTGVFDDGRYFDVFAEYAKASPNDLAIRITVVNRGPEAAPLHVLPTLWCRNTWSWGREGEGHAPRPEIRRDGAGLRAEHAELGVFRLAVGGAPAALLFTENETNVERLFGTANGQPYVKDAFHRYVVAGDADAVNPAARGSKAAAHFRLRLAPGESRELRLRLFRESEAPVEDAATDGEADRLRMRAAWEVEALGPGFDALFAARREEADAYWNERLPASMTPAAREVARQGYAGLLNSKQFYHFVTREWLEGDPAQPAPPPERRRGRNADWPHLHARDLISVCDKWEYPWFAAWDLAFHMIPFAHVDPDFTKRQLLLFLREWYMHPNGQIPAYEFAFGDVNPPVHAWAAWRAYKISAPAGKRDRAFLRRVFHKLVMNFTWWVNRKDAEGKHLFSGGFLGLDNIGVFDRSQPLPTGGHLEQADGTAWMAFYCATMLSMALELAKEDPAYEDMASRFFEHFVAIVDAINGLGGTGLWDEQDGFYYDEIHLPDREVPLKVRSMVGLLPLIAVEVLDDAVIEQLPGFKKRMEWFLENRSDLARHIHYCTSRKEHGHRLLAVPSYDRLMSVLRYLLDENEFLSPYGIRSVSRVHAEKPYSFWVNGQEHRVDYVPGESTTGLFGGNSNWRGPIWFPINFLIVEALERYGHYYGDSVRVECPTGSGNLLTLSQVAREIGRRLASLFLPDATGARPWQGGSALWQDPHWCELSLFHEYFHGETGRGLGASHQTGWTALAVTLLEDLAR